MSPTIFTVCKHVALAALLVACGGDSGGDSGGPRVDANPAETPDADPSAPDGGTTPLQFTDITCRPDVANGATIVADKLFECRFRVEGTPGRAINPLTCEDQTGGAIDCGGTVGIQLQPFYTTQPPIERGHFGGSTATLGRLERVWVAEDGVERTTYDFSAIVVADDGNQEPPTMTVTCNGVTGTEFQVPRGSVVTCEIACEDPDPDVLIWDYSQPSGQDVTTLPTPFSVLGPADFYVDWAWDIAANEPDDAYEFELTLTDQTVTITETLRFELTSP